MSNPIASRISRLGTETAFEVLARAKALEKQGKSVIHFEIGEPDFDTPKHIIDAGVKGLQSGATHYTPAPGILEFRETIVQHIKKTRGVDVSVDEVVVTPGAKPIIFFTILACVNEGDEVIYPNPGFPIYESMINFVGGVAVPLPLYESRRFRFDPEELRKLITPRTKMIIINSPGNPTGGVLTKTELENIAKLAREHNILVLSDEVYDEIFYDGFKNESILSFPGMKERTILLGGHSKNYAMTGWRLGYGYFPGKIAPVVSKLMVNSTSCTAHFTQLAGMAALTGTHEPTKKMVEEFQKRRDFIVDGLNKIGFRCLKPEGAFYVFPAVDSLKLPLNSKQLADYLLIKGGVAVLDGACFGQYGSGYIRLSYATSMENIKNGLARIEKAIQELRQELQSNPSALATYTGAASNNNNAGSNNWQVFNPNGSKRIVVTKQMPGTKWLKVLTDAGFRVEVGTSTDILSIAEIKQAIGTKCDGVIGQLTEKWGEELFTTLKNAGGNAYSNMAVGFDNVDVAAATKIGVAVGNTPGVLTETTSEMAISLTYAAARRLVEADVFMREGKYKGWLPTLFVGHLLHRKTVGIVGAGRIGAAYAKSMATASKMNVVYYDIYENKDLERYISRFGEFLKANGEEPITCKRVSSIDELLKTADVVSLHTNLDKTTFHLINKERLAMMKEDAILVNTSRGPVIDEVALVNHLKQFPNFRAALDVFEKEPQMAPGLASLPNAIIVPHIASATEWTRAGMALLAALNVTGVIKGYPLWNNPNDISPFLKDGEIPKAIPSLVNGKDIKNLSKL
mmetsp:Transcript_9346/g.12885  ORF Transcript_9346/g.12885 Transcript_9346/m.12885 type:complete len:797 (-) Transcript_9346:50-2440(-)